MCASAYRLINNINVCPITKFRDSLKTRTCSISARDIPHFLVLFSSCCRGNSLPREALPSKPDCVRTYLKHHARLLQQICPHVGADDAVASVEADLDVFPKPAAVVVPCRLCVPDGLRDRWQRMCEDSFLALDASQTAQNPRLYSDTRNFTGTGGNTELLSWIGPMPDRSGLIACER